jgi:ketosteroid isomerase-like protein
MKRSRLTGSVWAATLALLGVAALALAACGGSGTGTTASPTPTPPPPSVTPSPTTTAAAWQPGSDALVATTKVSARFLTMLRTRRFAASDIWSPQATLDLYASDVHASGADAVKSVYTGAAPESSWTAGHALVTTGVAAYEGLFAQSGLRPTAALDLLAVSGDKVEHEDVYLDLSGGRAAEAVTQWPSPPAPTDTVARTKKTATAFVDAMTDSGTLQLGLLLADDVLFYDTAQKRQQRGATELLTWWGGRAAALIEPQTENSLVVGPGWAAVRWVGTGAQSSTDDVTMPGAAMLEIRGGKVVRMTLYYDSATLALHL